VEVSIGPDSGKQFSFKGRHFRTNIEGRSNQARKKMIERISIVLAQWCPHCVPLSLENVRRMGKELGVPIRILDIDDAKQERIADELVAKYGDNSEDYIIPQVFLQYKDGSIQHIFTGFSEGVDVTKARWDDFFNSDFYRDLLKEQGRSRNGKETLVIEGTHGRRKGGKRAED
jgi:thiol-disulfide isomerase/thioredoxin